MALRCCGWRRFSVLVAVPQRCAWAWQADALRYNAAPLPLAPSEPCMFTLAHLDTPPPESLKAQVLQMVVDYLTEISPVSLTPSNPLFQLYQYVIGYEVHLYLQRMDAAQPGQPRLLLALDDEDPARVLGFALYLPYLDDPQACSLLYLAVLASHRNRGIGSALVAEMVVRFPHAQVACVASKAPYFEAQGFHALPAHGPQVEIGRASCRERVQSDVAAVTYYSENESVEILGSIQ